MSSSRLAGSSFGFDNSPATPLQRALRACRKQFILVGVFSGVVTFVILKLVDVTVGLRVSEVEEEHGLDLSQHGEPAYQL